MTTPTVPCPACGTVVDPPPQDAAAVTACPGCDHRMDTGYLREAASLGEWHAMAGRRLEWLHDRLAAGDLSEAARPLTPTPPPAALAAVGRDGAGALLLAVGAFLLVAAGVAFIAFTWDLLGPLGQVLILLLMGSACLAAAVTLTKRLRGTSMTLGVVGTLLIVISAIGARVLGPDLMGPTVSLLVSTTIATLLIAAAVRLRAVNVAVGELGALAGATVVVVEVAAAPADGALDLSEPWLWWTALVLGLGALSLFGLSRPLHVTSWPWLGAVVTVAAALTLGEYTVVTVDPQEPGFDGVLRAAVLLAVTTALCCALALIRHHRVATLTAASVLWLLALLWTVAPALTSPPVRPWIGLELLWAAVLPFSLGVASLRAAPNRWAHATSPVRHVEMLWYVAAITLGLAVGTLCAPWGDLRSAATATQWANEAWPLWRGVFVGLVASALLVGMNEADRRWRPDVPLSRRRLGPAAGIVALLSMVGYGLAELVLAGTELNGPSSVLDAALADSVDLGFTLFATVLCLGALARRLGPRMVWTSSFLWALAWSNQLRVMEFSSTTAWQPETFGAALGTASLLGALSWWWLRRPQTTPTWQTIGPTFVAAVAPSTLALMSDTADQWSYAANPGPGYQLRMVALLGLGTIGAIVGVRQRWGGLFFPGLALASLVVGIQLVDLGRFLPQWVSFAVAGAMLVAAGARWEWVRKQGRVGVAWVRQLR